MRAAGHDAHESRLRDGAFALAMAASIQAGLLYLLLRIPALPRPGIEQSALQVLFISRPPKSTAPRETASPAAMRATGHPRTRTVAHAAADAGAPASADPPRLPVPAGMTVADDVWSTGHDNAAPTGFRRNPFAAPQPDQVAVAPRVRLRMRPPPSPKAIVDRLGALLAGSHYRADPCPEMQDEIESLLANPSDAARTRLQQALDTQRALCR